jgi:pentatricopeptide repeat domain-containing protein 1
MNIAWRFYDEMLRNDLTPDNFTYSIMINGIKSNNTNKEELIKTINLLEKLEKMGDHFQPDEILYNSLIDACVKFNEINKALCLFEEMKKRNIEPSAITYGILIKAFGKMNDLVKAFKIFEQIKLNNLKINDVTYGCLLDACVKNNRIDLALVLFKKIKQDNITLNTILYTTLIKGFSKANKLEEALQIFQIMKQNHQTYPNIITYNCILDACVKSRAFDQALNLFEEMKGILNPDLITFSTLIKGFSKMGELKVAYHLFNSMIERKIIPDDPLINMILEACFCGKNSDMGLSIFETLNAMNVKFSSISYGIIIKVTFILKIHINRIF